ncbi:hypothetical protein LguiA_022440 [Lonicera macranthoides]
MENYYNGSSSSYTYATSPYNAYNGYSHYPYQYSYPYLYQSPWELHQQVINTTGSNLSHLEPTVQYSTGRLTCTFPDRELASREETILKHLKRRIHVISKDHPKSQEPEICVICQTEATIKSVYESILYCNLLIPIVKYVLAISSVPAITRNIAFAKM